MTPVKYATLSLTGISRGRPMTAEGQMTTEWQLNDGEAKWPATRLDWWLLIDDLKTCIHQGAEYAEINDFLFAVETRLPCLSSRWRAGDGKEKPLKLVSRINIQLR